MNRAGPRPPLPWRKRVLADLRVPTRMLVVVLVPLLAALGFSGLRVKDAWDRAEQYRGTELIAKASRTGTSLIAALANERDLAVDPRARGDAAGSDAKGRAATDAKARQFLKELGALPGDADMERQRKVTATGIDTLTKLRALADAGGAPAEVEHGYGGVIVSIASLYNQVGGLGEDARGAGWTLYTIALNNAMVTSQRAVLASAERSGTLNPGQQGNILSSQLVRDITGMEFGLYAKPAEAAAFQRVNGESSARDLTVAIQALGTATGRVDLKKMLPGTWYADLTRTSEALTRLQKDVESRVLAGALHQKDMAHEQMITDAVLAALVLLLATALVVATSRHLVRGLGWLRRSATEVADVHLPEVTRRLSRGGAELPAVLEGKVLDPRTNDEVGDVARAFDRVYLEAVRLAREQAELRAEVNRLFQNLSRRNQSLVQRQLAVITELEGREQSPDGLSHLFQLDHLATQIRRNSENLLVLAGAEITAERRETTGLLTLLRTAASEIEEYQRVTCQAVPHTGVVGYAADDLVHLVAELLDNAASFSSPDTWVIVSGQLMPDERLLLEIRDTGIGMSSEQLAEANAVLQRRTSGRDGLGEGEAMGLHVVSALARKHGVDVRLSANAPSGVVATVILPKSILGEPQSTTDGRAPLPRQRAVPGGVPATPRAGVTDGPLMPPAPAADQQDAPGGPFVPPVPPADATGRPAGPGAPAGPFVPHPRPGGTAGPAGPAGTFVPHPRPGGTGGASLPPAPAPGGQAGPSGTPQAPPPPPPGQQAGPDGPFGSPPQQSATGGPAGPGSRRQAAAGSPEIPPQDGPGGRQVPPVPGSGQQAGPGGPFAAQPQTHPQQNAPGGQAAPGTPGPPPHGAPHGAPHNRPASDAPAPGEPATRSGLPIRQRRPRAGSIDNGGGTGQGSAPRPDPDEIRRRMTGLTDGIANARPEKEE
ncbi:ATP-binding protein [Streptomyces gamaensis]|uniref:histidine kinase n=1 Tax=Streptomyces gamaensis TaxID=1763542 RepID=A0ABW0Z5A6_9ACTN